MHNVVLDYKNKLEQYLDFCRRSNKKMPAEFILCTTVASDEAKKLKSEDSIRFKYKYQTYAVTCIRPVDISYVDAVKNNSTMTLEGALFYEVFDGNAFGKEPTCGITKEQFLLECAVLGIMPTTEFIDDENQHAVDEIDLVTCKSYREKLRKTV